MQATLVARLTRVRHLTPILAALSATLLVAGVLALVVHDGGDDTRLATDSSTTTTTTTALDDLVGTGDDLAPTTPPPPSTSTTAGPATTTTSTTAVSRPTCTGAASVVDAAGLWLVDAADGRLRRVIAEAVERFTWSPDGKHLAYVAGPQEDRRLVVLDVPGSSRTVYDDLPVRGGPAWTADSAAIVFSARFEAGRDRLLSVPVGGGGATALHDAGSLVDDVEVAPDGTIAFTDGSTLAVVDGDGSDRRELADGVRSMALSPDGTCVAFTDNAKLAVATIEGAAVKDLGATEVQGRALAWSKDGARVAFVGVQGGRERAVAARPDGSERREVGVGGSSFSLAPNGAEVGWVSSATLTATNLSSGADRTVGTDMWQPTWAPGSSTLAVYAKVPTEARPALCLLGATPTRLAQFKGTAAPYAALAWSPSGSTVAFSSLA